jgi:hypothetical protein
MDFSEGPGSSREIAIERTAKASKLGEFSVAIELARFV